MIKTFISLLILGNIFFVGSLYAKGSLFIDFNYSQSKTFKNATDDLTLPFASATDKHNGKFFLVRTGFDSFGSSNLSKSTYYSSTVAEKTCEVKNSYTEFGVSEESSLLNKKISTLQQCVQIKVTDISGNPLTHIENKEKCSFVKIDANSALVYGSACFFQIKARSKFEVDVIENKDCSNRNFLTQNGINPTSFTGTLQTFIYPENSIGETFKPTKNLFDALIHVDINPGPEFFPIVDTFINSNEFISSPEVYNFPEVHIARLGLRKFRKNKGQIDISFFVNNKRKEKCINGICSSLSNYDLPVAAEMTIFDITKGKRGEWLYTGQVGGRIQNQWQGEFKSVVQHDGFNFEIGRRYKMEFLFSDPHYDFTALVNSLVDLIKSDQFESPFENLRAGGDEINDLRNIGRRSSISSLGGLTGDIFAKIPEGMRLQLDNVGDLNDSNFPSLYSKVCNSDGTKCRKASKNKHLILSVSFTVKSERRRKYKLADFEFERRSPLMADYKVKADKLPTIRCSLKKD